MVLTSSDAENEERQNTNQEVRNQHDDDRQSQG